MLVAKLRVKVVRLLVATSLIPQVLSLAADASPSSHFVSVNNAQLEYLDWGGQGPALVFIAGLGDTPYIYNDLAPEFLSRYHCFGLTRRGFGRSEQTAGGYELDNLVGDIAGFLGTLKLKDVTLVGHSFGAIEVLRASELHPELIRRGAVRSGIHRPGLAWPSASEASRCYWNVAGAAAVIDELLSRVS